MTNRWMLLSVFALLCAAVGAQSLVRETAFNQIQYGAVNTIVVLYWLNDPTTDKPSREILESAEIVAKNLAPQYPQLQWLKCNAAEYYTELLQAQIEKRMLPIVVISIDGMIRLENDNAELFTPAKLTAIIADGYAPSLPSTDVFGFASEDVLLGVSQQVPNVVRFHVSTCQFSKGMDKAWKRVASARKGQVQFVDVDCLRDKVVTAFCDKHSILASPKIMFFHRGRVVPYNYKVHLEEMLNGFIDAQLASAPAMPNGAGTGGMQQHQQPPVYSQQPPANQRQMPPIGGMPPSGQGQAADSDPTANIQGGMMNPNPGQGYTRRPDL